MADAEGASPQSEDESPGSRAPHEVGPQVEIEMELWDSLPGGRAIVGVEQEGRFVWLASKEHVSPQARDEFLEKFTEIVRQGWWTQNWPGSS